MKISEVLFKAAEGPLGARPENFYGSVRIDIDRACHECLEDFVLSCKAAGYYANLYEIKRWHDDYNEYSNENHTRLALTMAATIAEDEGL